LRLALLRLGAIGVIAVGVEILIHKEAIDKKVNDFLRGHGLGFLTGKQIKISPDVDLTKLTKLRDTVADTFGENDLMVKALDQVIDRISRAQEAVGGLAKTAAEHGRGLAAAIDQATGGTTPTSSNNKVVQTAAKTGKAAGDAAKSAFERAMAKLDIAFAQAQQTKSLQDDLRVLQQTEKVLVARIAIKKNDLDLQKQLVDLQGQELDLQKQIAANQREATKARQFKALGLTSTGEALTPGAGSLLHRAKSLREQVKGTVLDTPKTRSELTRIVNFLKSHLKTAGKEVRQAILNMLNDISSAADQKKGPLTKTSSLNSNKLLQGLDLSGADARTLKARLSNFNSAGVALAGAQVPGASGGEFVVHTTVNLDGQKVASNTTKHQQKSRRRNPQQKRGPNRR